MNPHPAAETAPAACPPVRRMPGGRRAFTLVELLVSCTCLLLMVVFLAQTLSQANNSWISGEASKERMQNERSVRDFVANELRGALLPVNRRNKSSLQLLVNPSDTVNNPGAAITASTYLNRDAIFWQAPLATDQTLGDVAEVGYFVNWDDDGGGGSAAHPHARLCRFFVNPNAGPGSTTANPSFKIYPPATGAAPNWLTDPILQTEAPATAASGYKGLFADNVVGLWVRCLDAYGQPITKTYAGGAFPAPAYPVARAKGSEFNSRLGFTDSTGAKSPGYIPAGSTTAQPLCALPAAVEISLVQLDSRSAARVGPAQKLAIQTLLATSQDVTDFINKVPANANLVAVRGGLHAYTTVVYLQNAK